MQKRDKRREEKKQSDMIEKTNWDLLGIGEEGEGGGWGEEEEKKEALHRIEPGSH